MWPANLKVTLGALSVTLLGAAIFGFRDPTGQPGLTNLLTRCNQHGAEGSTRRA
jgi:hypothetical protein